MLTLWFHLILYRFSRSREADKGKNKGQRKVQYPALCEKGISEVMPLMGGKEGVWK